MKGKKVSCSYALLFIILFAVVCFLSSYVVIDRKLNEECNSDIVKTDCPKVDCNCQSSLDYKDVAGYYKVDFDESAEELNSQFNLYLYTDGTFYYNNLIGNYILDDNYVILNVFFTYDDGMALDFSSKKLKFNDSKNLIDEETADSEIITLVKESGFTDSDNDNSMVKEMYKNSILYNDSER